MEGSSEAKHCESANIPIQTQQSPGVRSNTWFYKEGSKQIGPVDMDRMEALIKVGRVKRYTKVRQQGMMDWSYAYETELSHFFSPLTLADVPKCPSYYGGRDPRYYSKPESLRTMFAWYLILALVGICLMSYDRRPCGLTLVSYVLHLILLNRWWEVIQDGNARIGPVEAIMGMFVPLFNFFWWYVVYIGLGKDLNKYCEKYGIPLKISENTGLAYYICFLIGLFGLISSAILQMHDEELYIFTFRYSLLFLLVSGMLFLIYILQINDTVIEIIRIQKRSSCLLDAASNSTNSPNV